MPHNNPTQTKWTILFIVHAIVEDTRVYAEKLFAEILQANIDPDKVQVFVLHDSYDYDNTDEVHAMLYEIKRDATTEVKLNNTQPQSVLATSTNAGYGDKNASDKKEQLTPYMTKEGIYYLNKKDEHDLGPISIADEKGLDEVLDKVEAIINKAEKQNSGNDTDRKRIIVTWDHSNGFGFFDDSQSDIQIIKSSRRPDMLMVNELQRALTNYLNKWVRNKITDDDEKKKKKIEILIMMHCWMQNIEAGYQLKDVVEILIGAETVFDFQGYDFKKLINTISESAFYESKEKLAEQILDDIPEKLASIKYKPSEETEIFVSATKPPQSDLVKKEIDKLASALDLELRDTNKNLNLTLRKILAARVGCLELTKVSDGYTPWYFVDIFQAINKLEKDFPQVKQISKEIKNAFDQYIIKGVKINRVTSGEKLSGEKLPNNFKGVSICFPYQNDTFTIGTIYKIYYAIKGSGDNGPDKRIDFTKGNPPWPTFLNNLLNGVGNVVDGEAKKLREKLKKKANKKKMSYLKKESPTNKEIIQIVEKILSPVVNWQNFTLQLNINFDMIESQFLVNSVIANCTSIDESGAVTLFKTNPGDPTRGVPANGKNGVPATGKNGVPATGKNGVPATGKSGVPGSGKSGVPGSGKSGVPGELLPTTIDAYGTNFNKSKDELIKYRGYFWQTENGTEE